MDYCLQNAASVVCVEVKQTLVKQAGLPMRLCWTKAEESSVEKKSSVSERIELI
jgi:hypothetical protein